MATTIAVKDIQQGDKIRVTHLAGDRTVIYEGVANHSEEGNGLNGRRWRTAQDYALWTDYANAVIELLDRPKPKITVPTGTHAVVKYVGCNGLGDPLNRTAVRDGEGVWVAHDDKGYRTLTVHSDEAFSELLATKTGYKVIFEGVSK